jgi:prophage maintenance system killer protein
MRSTISFQPLAISFDHVRRNRSERTFFQKRFLGKNGVQVKAKADKVVELMLHIEDKPLRLDQIVEWLK